MFKFNFNVNNDEESIESSDSLNLKQQDSIPDIPCGIVDFKELDTLSSDNERLDSKFFKKLYLDEGIFIEYFYIENSNLLNLIKNNEDLIEITKTHDLVNGKYEGGFKVWECSIDLANYLYKKYSFNNNSEEFSILELGCGHALPSLSFLKRIKNSNIKVLNIYLQDYNRDCIELITYLNVKKFLVENADFKIKELNIKFLYGDWKSIETLVPMEMFDLILTSETIYNCLYYKSLLDLCKHALKPNCCILLAAKTYYFGCGGNLHEFLNLANSNFYNFKTSNNLLCSEDDKIRDQIHGTVSREIIKLF